MIIPLSNEQKPIFNWFMAYSYMLAPNDEKLRSQIYNYRMLQYVLGKPARAKKFFSNEQNEMMIAEFRQILLNQSLRQEILKLRRYVKRIGEIVRFLNTMELLEIEDPSINKADYLSKIGFKKREAARGGGRTGQLAYGRKTNKKYRNHFNKVLHLCAAYSMMSPDNSKIKVPKSQRIQYFFAKAHKYREFLLSFEFSRQLNKEEYREYIRNYGHALQVDKKDSEDKKDELLSGPLCSFPDAFEFPETTVCFETAKFLGKVKERLSGYSSDWDEKPSQNK